MADIPSLNIFVPLSKVDEENRLVYGLVAEEIEDNSGEMFDYQTSKPNFEKWSASAETMSRGLSKGNLRSMHGSVAAGVLTDLGFDDDNKRIECCAKVVDDNEWKKVLAGVYTGFSMGGKYEKRWVEKADGGKQVKRYTALPCEVSLVDKPCIPTATFDFIKGDGMVVQVHHGDVIDEQAAEELGKTVQKPFEPRRHAHRAPTGEFTKKPTKDVANHGGSDPTGHGSDQAKPLTEDEAVVLFGKSEGATQMTDYVPTNDELSQRGMELAKADGKDGAAWLEYSDVARDQLIAEHLAKADGKPPFGKDKEGEEEGDDKKPAAKEGEEDADAAKEGEEDEDDAKKDDAKKGAGLEQVWKTGDGQTFLKKADAVSHQKELDGASGAPKTLAEQIEMAKAAVNSLEKSDDEPVGGDDVEKKDDEANAEADKAAGAECEKYAKFFGGLDTDTLRKGLYEVSRMASALRECASLQICVASEARREGDGSPVSAAILDGVRVLGDALVAMAKEEVEELTTRLAQDENPERDGYAYPDSYMALAASALGLEKSDLDEMAKKDTGSLEKRDGDIMAKFTKIEDENALLKADLASARKEIDEATPLIKSLMDDVERIKKLPRPSAPMTSVALSKADDVSGASASGELDLAKFTPDQLADAAIRMAQSQGRSLMAARGGSE